MKSFLCWQISHLVKSSYVHQWRVIPDFSQYNHIKHRPTHDFVSDQILDGLRQIVANFDMVPSWLSWPGGLKQCHKTTKTLGPECGWIVGIWKGLNKIQHVFMENIQKLKYISTSFSSPINVNKSCTGWEGNYPMNGNVFLLLQDFVDPPR